MEVLGILKDQTQEGMIRLGQQVASRSDSRKDVILATFTEISRRKMIFTGITPGLTQKTPKTTGKLIKKRPDRAKPNMITLRISIRQKEEADSKAHNKNIEQMSMATLKKKLNGGVVTPKKRKSSTRRTSMGTLSDSRREANTAPMGGTQKMLQILNRNTMTLFRTSTNSRNKDLTCIKRRKKSTRSMSLKRTQILAIRIGASKPDRICSGGRDGQHGSILGYSTHS